MHVRLRVEFSGGRTTMRDVVGEAIRLGRNSGCEVAVDPTAFPKVSGIHARIESSTGGFVLVPLSRSNKTLLNDVPIDGPSPIQVGDRVRLGFTGPMVEVCAIEPSGSSTPTPVEFGETVQADVRHLALLRGTARIERSAIGTGGVIGREAGAVRYQLDHPHVSRLHASLAVEGGRVVLADLGSANGTFLNGRRLSRPAALSPNDRIDIGPFSLRFDGGALISRSRSNNIELVARGLTRVVRDRASGLPLMLLDDIGLVIRPREFVCLLGPSGSGKSTLLTILSGRNRPDSGSVAVNGEDLFAHFEALKEDIAVVPQKDILHDSLTLGAALRYTAELRLPPDLSRDEVGASVSDILGVVGLTPKRGTLIRHLSGGQVKRASLANELVSRPSLLFLDEVTSGLDEQTDREVMELFREVADGGKTVVCVTHSLANVEATCHLVVILTEGGRLAFVGTPDEAKAYFHVSRLGDVYRRLAEQPPESWQARYRASPYFARYVADRMPSDTAIEDHPDQAPRSPAHRKSGGLRQAWVLTRRYISIWKGDRQALLAMLGQGLLVAILLGLVFGRLGDIPGPVERVERRINLLLLLAVSCFWFGCNTAAKELVKERVIFLKERDFNLRVGGYFLSKFAVLSLIGLAQASVLFAIVRAWCGPQGPAGLQWLVLALLSASGTAIGLLISALARTEDVATALVPMAVIPQIILGGVIAPLGGLAKGLAEASMSVYWGQRALERLLPESELMRIGREKLAWGGPAGIVLAQAGVACAAALIVLSRARERSK
jgi:ABC-type multidrug transport system ATPase subunit/pSer/pThr/pTyr-binding forkhead associated (FHA) protein